MLDFLHMYQDSKLFILYHSIFHNWSQDSKKTHKQIIEGQVEFKACLKKNCALQTLCNKSTYLI